MREVSPVYIVGGAVRDHLLGRARDLNDLDIVIDGPAVSVARRLADRLGWAFYVMDAARDIGRLVFTASRSGPLVCDISACATALSSTTSWRATSPSTP